MARRGEVKQRLPASILEPARTTAHAEKHVFGEDSPDALQLDLGLAVLRPNRCCDETLATMRFRIVARDAGRYTVPVQAACLIAAGVIQRPREDEKITDGRPLRFEIDVLPLRIRRTNVSFCAVVIADAVEIHATTAATAMSVASPPKMASFFLIFPPLQKAGPPALTRRRAA